MRAGLCILNNRNDRMEILQPVKTPLGFFTVVILVVEVIMGVSVSLSQGLDRKLLILGKLN